MKDDRLNVLIISDSTELVNLLREQIIACSAFRVTGMGYLPQQILDVCKALKPFFLILDTVIQNGNLLEIPKVEEIQKKFPRMNLVLLVKNEEKRYVKQLKNSIDIVFFDRNDPDVLPYIERVGEQFVMKSI